MSATIDVSFIVNYFSRPLNGDGVLQPHIELEECTDEAAVRKSSREGEECVFSARELETLKRRLSAASSGTAQPREKQSQWNETEEDNRGKRRSSDSGRANWAQGNDWRQEQREDGDDDRKAKERCRGNSVTDNPKESEEITNCGWNSDDRKESAWNSNDRKNSCERNNDGKVNSGWDNHQDPKTSMSHNQWGDTNVRN